MFSTGVVDQKPETSGHTIEWAPLYDACVSILALGKTGALREATLELAAIRPGERVLDIGCGTGDLTRRAAVCAGLAARSGGNVAAGTDLASRSGSDIATGAGAGDRADAGAGGYVVGIDASPQMIDVARRKAQSAGIAIDYRVAAAEALPFPDASFDLVLSSLMIHHLPPALRPAVLREVRRVLAPGGRVVVVDFGQPGSRSIFSFLPMLFHQGGVGMNRMLQDVADSLTADGFTAVETGNLGINPFRFVRARYPSGDDGQRAG